MTLDTREEDAVEERSGDHDDEENAVDFDDDYEDWWIMIHVLPTALRLVYL